MKSKLLLSSLLTLFAAISANAQWYQQLSGTSADLYCVHCIDANTCYAVGALTAVRKTNDGGATPWFTPGGSPGFTSKNFVKMLNKDTVLIGQANCTYRKTTTGSTSSTWSLDIFGGNTSFGLYDVAFLSNTNFVTVGGTASTPANGGYITSTSVNTGANWTAVNISGGPTFYGVHALSSTTLVACGGGESVYKTTDAGANWTSKKTGSATVSLYDINFPDPANPGIGYVVGGSSTTLSAGTGGVVYKTTDGGETWAAPANAGLLPNTLYGVHFVSKDTGYVVGNGGKIQVTKDGGATWAAQISPVTTDLNKIYFTNKNVGYIAGLSGVILKTIDGGFIAPLVANAGSDKSVCPGGCNSIGAGMSASGGTTPYSYIWNPGGGTDASITVCPSAVTMYTVTVTDTYGNTSVDSVSVGIYPATSLSITGLNANYCSNEPAITLTGNPAGGTFTGTGVTAGTFNPLLTGPGTFSVTYTYTDGNTCVSSTGQAVNVLGAPTAVPICLVSVDTAVNASKNSIQNIITWKNPANPAIDSIILYRKSGTAMVVLQRFKYSVTSKYTDAPPGVNPMVKSETYELAVKDTCGIESALSFNQASAHTTIFLKTPAFNPPLGFTFQWFDYTGIPVSLYEIWRDANNTGTWSLLTAVTNTVNVFTDNGAPKTSRYRIEVSYPTGGCQLSKTYSNVSDNQTGVEEISLNNYLSVYPNPSNGMFTFELTGIKYKTASVKVVDMMGRAIYETSLKDQRSEISIPGIAPGIYQLQVRTEQGVANKKITIQ